MDNAQLKTFVSFSNKDGLFVSKLLARLRAQPLNVWLYSMEGEEIPAGVDVSDYLRERVEQSTLFIPVVSEASMASAYTTVEVATALGCHTRNNLKIIALVDVRLRKLNRSWSAAYEPLRHLRYLDIDFEDRALWEDAIRRICENVQVQYRPFSPEDVRLPLSDRFYREIETRVPRNEERTHALHARLMKTLNAFAAAWEAGDYTEALRAIEYFLALCEYECSGERFYYPYVTKAVCLMALGRLPEATELLVRLRPVPTPDPTDNSVLGALGYIKQAQGQYREAADCYRESSRRDPSDAAAATGVVVNEILSGRRVGIAEAIEIIQTRRFLTEQDRQNARAILAMGLAQVGRSAEAAEIFFELQRQGQADAGTLINFANVLIDLRQSAAAREVLEKAVERFPHELMPRRWLGRFYMEVGPMQSAVPHLETLIELQPDALDARFDLLLVLVKLRKRREAERNARELLAKLPGKPDDYYFTGFANWLLGKSDRARYDFERSGQAEQAYYDNLPDVRPLSQLGS